MKILPILPILLPMATAVLSVLFRVDERRAHGVALGGAVLHLVAGILLLATVLEQEVLALWVGNWPAPFGICLVADYLSAVMVLITAVIHTTVTVYARLDIDSQQVHTGFYPFMQILTAAVCGAFLTGDLFNLYVWFEVILMASFGLLVMGHRPGRLTGAVKYVTVNLISTIFFITAIGLIYGLTFGIGIGVASVVSRGLGSGEITKVQRAVVDSLLLGTAIVLVLMVAGLLTIEPVFRLIGGNDVTMPYVREYMEVWYWGVFTLVVPFMGMNAIRASGDMKAASRIPSTPSSL